MSGNERNCLFRNDGDQFTEVGWVTGAGSILDGRGFIPADLDRDGDLDFLVVNDGQPFQYFENRMPSVGNWIGVQLRGDAANRSGIGSRVTIEAGGRKQVREIHLGSGYLSSPPPEAHFGIGSATSVDHIEIRWPDGTVQRLGSQRGNRYLVVEKGGSSKTLDVPTRGTPR